MISLSDTRFNVNVATIVLILLRSSNVNLGMLLFCHFVKIKFCSLEKRKNQYADTEEKVAVSKVDNYRTNTLGEFQGKCIDPQIVMVRDGSLQGKAPNQN